MTEGAVGEYIDFYMGDVPESDYVLIIDQAHSDTGKFDEARRMINEEFDQRATQRVFVTLWHASRWRALPEEQVPTQPHSAQDYARAGLPWFQHYGRAAAPLPGLTLWPR